MNDHQRIASLVVATIVGSTTAAVATSVAQRAAEGQTGADGVMIHLGDDSRFDFAVAGTVQFPSTDAVPVREGPAGPSITSTTAGRGSTIDLDATPLSTAVLEQPAVEPATEAPASEASASDGSTSSQPSVTFRNADSDAGRRGMQALEAIDYPWPEVLDGWTVSFHPGRTDISGLVHFDRREIELYVRSSHTDAQLARVMAHEIGHVVDWRHVDGTERQRWLEQRGLTGRAWYPSSGTNDFSSPAGDFAEAFAVWLLGGQSAARIGGPVSQADLDLMAQIGLPD